MKNIGTRSRPGNVRLLSCCSTYYLKNIFIVIKLKKKDIKLYLGFWSRQMRLQLCHGLPDPALDVRMLKKSYLIQILIKTTLFFYLKLKFYYESIGYFGKNSLLGKSYLGILTRKHHWVWNYLTF